MIRYEAGEGLRREARGSEMFFKAVGGNTAGRFSIMERTLAPKGRMPPTHRHGANDEAYFILEGEVEFHVEDAIECAGVGTFILVAAGERHTFGNTSDEASRLLVLHAPALDHYFEELETLWSAATPPEAHAEAELMARHGMDLI